MDEMRENLKRIDEWLEKYKEYATTSDEHCRREYFHNMQHKLALQRTLAMYEVPEDPYAFLKGMKQ